MYHFFTEKENIGETNIRITGPDVNHMKNVLRMKPGEVILISSREGGDYLCKVSELENDYVDNEILEVRDMSMELPARIHLYQGLPKSDKMELIIQKAVELGAYRIIPVAMKRSIVKIEPKKEEARIKRWNAISESAAKQSKRSLIPEVTKIMTFGEALKDTEGFGLKLVPYECADGIEGTRKLIDSAEAGMDIAVFIGPEGGFDEAEIEKALACDAKPVTLGRRILRTETAGLCMISALMLKLEV